MSDGDFTKRISKGGSNSFAAMTVTITEAEGGWYGITLSTAHTNTLGILSMYFTHDDCLQINLQFRVEARLLDNLAYPSTSGRSIDVATTGVVGLDLANTEGALVMGTDITGGVTLAQAAAMAASAALTAYDPPTGAEISAALTAIEARQVAQATSSALAAYDPPTKAEMDAGLAALNDIAVADILAATADGSLSVQDALKSIISYVRGRITKSSTAFTYYSQTSSSLWVNNITTVDRNIL